MLGLRVRGVDEKLIRALKERVWGYTPHVEQKTGSEIKVVAGAKVARPQALAARRQDSIRRILSYRSPSVPYRGQGALAQRRRLRRGQ